MNDDSIFNDGFYVRDTLLVQHPQTVNRLISMVAKSDITVPQEAALRANALKILKRLYMREHEKSNQTVGLKYTYIEMIQNHIDKLEAAVLTAPDRKENFNEEIQKCIQMLVDPAEQLNVVNFPDEKPVPIEQYAKIEPMANPGDLIIQFEEEVGKREEEAEARPEEKKDKEVERAAKLFGSIILIGVLIAMLFLAITQTGKEPKISGISVQEDDFHIDPEVNLIIEPEVDPVEVDPVDPEVNNKVIPEVESAK